VEVLFSVSRALARGQASGAIMFNLRSGLKADWIDTDLSDNTAGWRSEWFYITDQIPGLP
jgi:hypothetical protein